MIGLGRMGATHGRNGMLPEQVWDQDSPSHSRHGAGRPTGSAMPLAWAHAEFIKLVLSSQLGRPFDFPEAVFRRYQSKPMRPR
jgi:glucoamylase